MEIERYKRQIILKDFGLGAQECLANARVLVIGAGGLGCPVLQYLTSMGVGCIGVVDDDVVSLSNLHRQILYSSEDIGLNKAEVAFQKLKAQNPEVRIISYPVRLQRSNIIQIVNAYDYVFDGSDNFETRYLINDVTAILDKSLIFAAVSDFEGQLAVFNLADEKGVKTNYRDIFPKEPNSSEILNCTENGILGVVPGVIGAMAAAEIIKIITGIGKPLLNKLLHYNVLTHSQYELDIIPAANYTLPTLEMLTSVSPDDSYDEISYSELLELQLEESTLLIDVRDYHELPFLDEGVFQKISLAALSDFLTLDHSQEHLIFICQQGNRSILAAQEAKHRYGKTKKVYSLKGGVSKWKDYLL
jgi:molybdopterin/thiamine biosynthesis adenylyltransferase/rhodanese-related sulfurtransferase